MRTVKEIIIQNLLLKIKEEEDKLSLDDVEGHTWWGKFYEFIKTKEI